MASRPTHHSPTRATVLVALLFLGGLLGGAWVGAAAAARAQDPYAALDLLARVLTTIEADYVDEVSTEDLVAAAIQGMIDELDDHSRWLTPEQYAAFRDETRGRYEGIGIEVRAVPEGVLVAQILPGGPAERDGLRQGDLLVALDGESLIGVPLEEVAARIKGPRGTRLELSVVREGHDEVLILPTVRDRVVTPTVEGERLASGVLYLRILGFHGKVGDRLLEEIERLAPEGAPAGIALDLRDNPGGLLDQAVAVADVFLDEGLIVSTRSRRGGPIEYHATARGIGPDVPVVVLVNGLSASASEIVAGALQDTGRGVLLGTSTYGKGSVQVLYENPNRSALKLTTARYYTPSGEPVAPEEGRPPDHLVELAPPPPPQDALRERVATLDLSEEDRTELLELLGELPGASPTRPLIPWRAPFAERLETDPQLAAAIALLEGRSGAGGEHPGGATDRPEVPVEGRELP